MHSEFALTSKAPRYAFILISDLAARFETYSCFKMRQSAACGTRTSVKERVAGVFSVFAKSDRIGSDKVAGFLLCFCCGPCPLQSMCFFFCYFQKRSKFVEIVCSSFESYIYECFINLYTKTNFKNLINIFFFFNSQLLLFIFLNYIIFSVQWRSICTFINILF